IESHLAEGNPYFVGRRFSIADIALFAYAHLAPDGGYDLAPYPAVRDWIERVRAEPGHIAIDER
ncbi:MAG: glutathione S-transferase family protein, partial [Alphaproteobacteria bacterium]|nr:glutathione S-transferase family protein [Alphaproteobacteria bacterium]